MPGTVADKSSRCTLAEYLRRDLLPVSERIDLAKRILAAVARRHEAGLPAGRLTAESLVLHGVRSFKIELADDGPVSGVRRRGETDTSDEWARNDVRALGRLLSQLLPDDELPPATARVLAAMNSETDCYTDARLAMNAFARVVR